MYQKRKQIGGTKTTPLNINARKKYWFIFF